ncbi:MAG TPA: diguanylate cyclase, partial [Myxococcales bacterium]|nr:diguanylate cyclase [Myxococcales bacterium]
MIGALESLARSEGADVRCVSDGAEGLKIACNHEVDLVLAAAGLPGLDGLRVLRMLRALDHRRYVPVMIVLPADNKAQRLEALRLGADDVIAPPFDDAELRARIARTLLVKQRFDEVLEESARLQQLSVTDGLTDVYNHRYFQDRLREEFRRAQRYDDPLALILLDLDHFKNVNDHHGHQVGDQVLHEVAGAIKKGTRETDILARYGGEEFA